MAKADDTISTTEQWMPLAAAVARAGSLEALLPVLLTGHAFARCAEWRTWPGGSSTTGDRSIHPDWWAEHTLHEIDPVAGRAIFTIGSPLNNTAIENEETDFEWQLVAIGLEVERGPVDKQWPVKPKPPRSKRTAEAGRQRRRVLQALKKRYPPDGKVPDDVPTEVVRGQVIEELLADSKNRGLADPSWDTVNRTLGRRG
jgi:hypothetical protein